MSIDVTFLENTPFFPSPFTYPSQGENDDLLVNTITYPLSSSDTSVNSSPDGPIPVVPPLV